MFNLFNREPEPTEEAKRDLTEALMKRAEAGEHIEKETLCNIYSYKAAKDMRNAVEKVVLSMRKSANAMFENYLRAIEGKPVKCDQLPGASEFAYFLAYKELNKFEHFYTVEYNLIQEMIDEYESYIFRNPARMVTHILGYDREDVA
jgi:hypothetical protein